MNLSQQDSEAINTLTDNTIFFSEYLATVKTKSELLEAGLMMNKLNSSLLELLTRHEQAEAINTSNAQENK